MNRVEKLIQELCPNGVEHKALGDIAVIDRGNGMPKTMLTNNGVGAIHYGQIYTHYGPTARETLSFVTPEDAAKLTVVHSGDSLLRTRVRILMMFVPRWPGLVRKPS